MALNILTPLAKVTRVSRVVDPSSFTATPGIWGYIGSDGSIKNIQTGTNNKINKLVISSKSSSAYESQDIAVGRIATLETPGARCTVTTTGYVPTSMTQGALLVVGSDAGNEGKLEAVAYAAAGTYEVVAICESIDATNGILTFETLSPSFVTK